MTERGEALFHDLRKAATAFDRRLRAGLTAEDVAALGSLLGRLAENAGAQKSMTE
jgi:MarR family transcriptional regulator for hemolysin